MTHSVTN